MEQQERHKKNFISLIIPAYRQEKTIKNNLLVVKKTLDSLRYDYEIILVVDGRGDKTFEKAKNLKLSKVRVFGYKHNHGKGFAVRYGMVRSRGQIVCFIDSGIDLNPNGLRMLLDYFEWHNADIVIGSKRHPKSLVVYPWHRKIISFFSQLFIRFLFGLNVRDTQVGMKAFKRKVIEDVMPRLLVKKFAFDIEILAVSYSLGYRKIFECPVEIKYDFSRSLIEKNFIVEVVRTFWDALAIFYRLNIQGYYKDRNKRKWRFDKELGFKINTG